MEDPNNNKIIAPFSQYEIDCFNQFQQNEFGHPYTCPNDRGSLEIKAENLYCPECSYVHYWFVEAILFLKDYKGF